MKSFKEFLVGRVLREEGENASPVNTVGSGGIAGVGIQAGVGGKSPSSGDPTFATPAGTKQILVNKVLRRKCSIKPISISDKIKEH